MYLKFTSICSRLLLTLALPLLAMFGAAELVSAETMVSAREGGTSYQAGLANTWRSEGEKTVVFTLRDGVDGDSLAVILADNLPNVRIAYEKPYMTIIGLPEKELLARLATIDSKGDALADLADMGGDMVAMQGPEAGGSIRASKPDNLISLVHQLGEHEPDQRFMAQVVGVERGTFPSVNLRLRITRLAKTGDMRKKLRVGRVIDAQVHYSSDDGKVNLNLPVNQRNLVAYYLEKGDRVLIHPVAADNGAFAVDWIMRQ